MAVKGWVYKRCPHGTTGTPARGTRPAVKACTCKRGSWYWRAESDPDPHTGKRNMPSRGGYPTKDEAQDALTEQLDKMRRRVTTSDRGYTVSKWLTEWLRDGTWEPTTRTGYTNHVTLYLTPLLGRVRLRDLDRRTIAEALTAIANGDPRITRHRDPANPGRGRRQADTRSPSTVDNVRRTLRSALTAAIDEGLIAVNPAAGRFKQIGNRSRAARWWQPTDLEKFLTHVAVDPDCCLWVVAAFTGLRRSEILGCRWADVDLTSDHPGITIRQKCVQANGVHPCTVCGDEHTGRILKPGSKTTAGTNRWVPLVGRAVTELITHRAEQEALRQSLGDHWAHHNLIWPDTTHRKRPGAPRRPDQVTKRHAQLVRESGAPIVDLHEMRHGAVSLLAAAGMPPDQIALIIGHASDAVTKAVYLHGIQSALSEKAQAAADLVGQPKPPER